MALSRQSKPTIASFRIYYGSVAIAVANRSFHYAAGNAAFNFLYFGLSPSSCVFSESFAPDVVIKSCNRSSALQVPVLTIGVFQARITIDVPLNHGRKCPAILCRCRSKKRRIYEPSLNLNPNVNAIERDL